MSTTKLSQEHIVFTTHLSPKGRARGRDATLEVIGALPDEEVLVAFGSKQKKVRQCYLRKIVKASADRVQPQCCHVPQCGGCSLQQMSYAAQLNHKQEIIKNIFAQYDAELKPIIGCEDPWRYRNKMEFSFSENREGEPFLGLMLAGARGRVFNLSECHLVSEWFSETLAAVRQWWKKSGLRAYHHRLDRGHLRTLTLREAKQGRGKMVMLTVSGNPTFALKKENIESFIATLTRECPDEQLSIFLQIHQIAKGRPTQFFEMLLSGPDHITEKLNIAINGKTHSLDFKISPTSFFQPNTLQAEKLYSAALQTLSNLSDARVLDLYCGGATIGLSAATHAKEVVGVELNPHSVFDAGWNAEVNKIENFSIHRGDVGQILPKLAHFAPHVVIVDPPRSGLDAAAMVHLKKISPKEILYISCNPQTQVANIEELCEAGYRLQIVQPIDQFPHTIHIENVCLLQKG